MLFLYSQCDGNSLYQGDVIRRTEGLDSLLEKYHPHYYAKQQNKYFIVITQSCDLVRRKSAPCKSPYISIASVRPISWVLKRELSRLFKTKFEEVLRVTDAQRRGRLSQFIERLLNNNEPQYFYLPRESTLGFEQDMCAVLQLSIPLKANEHYDLILAGKTLQLTDSFQHKLGYLVGNSYGRIGTQDWAPDNIDHKQFRKMVKDTESTVAGDVTWLEEALMNRVSTELSAMPESEWTKSNLETAVKKHKKSTIQKRKEVLDAIADILKAVEIDTSLASRVIRRIENNEAFATNVK